MIFRVFKIYRNVKEGVNNPTGFAHDEALGMLRGAILPLTIIGIVCVVVFFLLGYTSWWFGPSGFFKVLFVIGLVAWIIWFLITRIIMLFAKQILRQTKQKVDTRVYHDVTPR